MEEGRKRALRETRETGEREKKKHITSLSLSTKYRSELAGKR
jgi:hypothetical protein